MTYAWPPQTQPRDAAVAGEELAPQIILCSGEHAQSLARALSAHAPAIGVIADYAANGLVSRTGTIDRVLDISERSCPDIADELRNLGLPEQPETGNLFEDAAPGAVYVIAASAAASSEARLRHKVQDWLFILAPPGLTTRKFFGMHEAALAEVPARMGVDADGTALAHVRRVSRHLKSDYELIDPPSADELLWQMRYLAERIPFGSKLVIALAEDAAGDAGAASAPLPVDAKDRSDTPATSPDAEQAVAARAGWLAHYSAAASALARHYPFVGFVTPDAMPSGMPAEAPVGAGTAALASKIVALIRHLPARADRPPSRRRLQRLIAEQRARPLPVPAPTRQAGQAAAAEPEVVVAPLVKTTIIESRQLRVPDELQVNAVLPKRVLIIGSCLSAGLARRLQMLKAPVQSDLYFAGNDLPAKPKHPIGDYDFQIIQLPLRVILPDAAFARLAHSSVEDHAALLERSITAMLRQLDIAMRWTTEHGLLTFVFPFVVPSQNLAGRLLPRYELRNPVYFVERLNEALARQLESISNAFYVDVNEINAYFGRRFVQDDVLTLFNHNNVIGNFDAKADVGRLEPPGYATDYFAERVGENFAAVWNELVGMYRTVRQVDQVKMVVVDLDDTMWRGLIGEHDPDNLPTSEGWPKGLWESLLFLKRRGILLGILSKNDEEKVLSAWPKIFRRNLLPEDFVAREINWQPKAANLQKILDAVNLLPSNVVCIDDNPVERAALQAAFPTLRVLGGSPLLWRRILLWAPETQVATITAESSARSDMVRAQAVREEHRHSMTREAFLASLKVSITMMEIVGADHPRFARVLELINKTNQFNTTGQRWTLESCKAHFAAGHVMMAFDVTDHYTDYGLVGVLVLRGQSIAQFVMSCRVFGMEIEKAAVALAGKLLIARGARVVTASLQETDRNTPCRDVFAQCGFRNVEGVWVRAADPWVEVPPHIDVMNETAPDGA